MIRYKSRILILVAVFALIPAVLILRLGQMQIVWGERFSADYRRGTGADNILDTIRGTIYTADGQPLAKDVISYDLAVYYPELESDEWIPVVANLTDTPPQKLRERADRIIRRVQRIWEVVYERTQMEGLRIVEQNQYHPLVTNVPRAVAVQVKSNAKSFDGIRIVERSRRAYFTDNSFTHIVGHCSRINADTWERLYERDMAWTQGMPARNIGSRYLMDDSLGVGGIERSYEEHLRGERGYVENRIEFHPFRVERVSQTHPPQGGSDIHLTLNERFQKATMEVFSEAASAQDSIFQSGAVVIMDVETGAVLTAATWPSYTAEEYSTDYSSILERGRNPLIFRPFQAALSTGSVFKPLCAIAALEEDIIAPQSVLRCEGRKDIHGRNFGCLGTHGSLRLEDSLEMSCNIFYYELALNMSRGQISKWGRKFGFGSRTGIDWPGESAGLLETADSTLARVNLSIGQGRLTSTPLQIARMKAAIANGGNLLTPYLVEKITDHEGNVVHYTQPENTRIPITPSNLNAIRAGMIRSVEGTRGTARQAGLERYKVAGKTGTAEIGPSQPNNAWFAGFAPYDNPKIAFAIVIERTEGYGGGDAAPLMRKILDVIWEEISE